MLLQVVRQESLEEMHALIDKITGEGITREEARQFNREKGRRSRSRNYTFKYKPDDEAFQFRLTFPRAEVEPDELIQALQQILEKLRDGLGDEEAGRPAGARRGAGSRVDRPAPPV